MGMNLQISPGRDTSGASLKKTLLVVKVEGGRLEQMGPDGRRQTPVRKSATEFAEAGVGLGV